MGNVGLKELTMRGLADKRALITGGASGIGAATVRRFLEEGSRVAVLDHDEEGCRRIEEEAPGLSGTITCDVSDPEAVKRAFIELDELFGGLDVLINNAGISIRHPDFTELPVEKWQRVVNVVLNFILIPTDIQSLGIKLMGLGAVGAAIATVIAFIVGLVYIRIMAWKITGIKGSPSIILHGIAAAIRE